MSSIEEIRPPTEQKKPHTLRGAAIGMVAGCLCWAASGMISGALLMLCLWGVMQVMSDRGYMPYHASFLGDVWFMAKWAGLVFAVPGAVAGAAIGGRIGRRDDPGVPRFRTILKWSWNSYGSVLSAVALLMARSSPQAVQGALDADDHPEQSLEADLASTSKWAAWSALFVFGLGLLALLCLWAPCHYLLSPAEVEGIVSPYGGVEYATPEGARKFTQTSPSGASKGDKVRVRAHFERGYDESWVQTLLPGELPNKDHRLSYAGLGIFGMFSLIFGPLAVAFFHKAIWRK